MDLKKRIKRASGAFPIMSFIGMIIGLCINFLSYIINSNLTVTILIAIVLLILMLLSIKFIIKSFDYKNSGSFKELSNWGNPDEILEIIEHENFKKIGRVYVTDNWVIMPQVFSVDIIPKRMILAVDLQVNPRRMGKILYLHLLDGRVMFGEFWSHIGNKLAKELAPMGLYLKTSSDYYLKEFDKMKEIASKEWEEYSKEEKNLYKEILLDENNQKIIDIRKKFNLV